MVVVWLIMVNSNLVGDENKLVDHVVGWSPKRSSKRLYDSQ